MPHRTEPPIEQPGIRFEPLIFMAEQGMGIAYLPDSP